MDLPLGLVVDDNPQVRSLLAEVLRRNGMRVLEAASGGEAFHLAKLSRLSFVVTDLEMPGGDGLMLCRQLREVNFTAGVPIVVVTGSGTSDEAVAAGCDVVLAKPCSPAELVATIRRLISEKTGAR